MVVVFGDESLQFLGNAIPLYDSSKAVNSLEKYNFTKIQIIKKKKKACVIYQEEHVGHDSYSCYAIMFWLYIYSYMVSNKLWMSYSSL